MHLGYKKLRKNRIAVLEIIGQHNEARPNIVNAATAKYRCSEAMVIGIYDMFDKNTTYQKGTSLWDCPKLVYRVGKKVRARNFDQNLESECSNGIHYFLSEECAFFWRSQPELLLHHWTGEFQDWEADGEIAMQYTIVNGKKNGLCKTYNSFYNEYAHYKDGLLHGQYNMYYKNGRLIRNGLYNNGKQVGEWTSFDEDGAVTFKYFYNNGKLHGRQLYWEEDCFGYDQYTNGVRDGLSEEWFYNGQLRTQRSYMQDKLHGIECEWLSNGQLILEREWSHGKKHGKQVTNSDNGTLQQILYYSNGHRVQVPYNRPNVHKCNKALFRKKRAKRRCAF